MAFLLLITATLLPNGFASGPSDIALDLEFAARLRNQGMPRLAEVQCEQLLKNNGLSAKQRIHTNIELTKALTARALNSRQPKRDEFWQRAEAILQTAITDVTAPSDQVLLELQLGLTMLERAEWSRREGEIRANTEADWQTARSQIRATISQLKKVEETLVTVNRQRDEEISASEIAELRRNINYHLSRAYRNQAITYRKNPADQVRALTGALNYLKPLANDTVADELVWKSRVDRIECYRLRGDLERASKLITNANETNVPVEFTARIAAEGVRLALAARNPQAAQQFFQTNSQSKQMEAPELQLARIETLVALGRSKAGTAGATSDSDLQSYQREAAEVAARLGQRHGTYWGMRGEILLTRLAGSASATGQNSLLDTTAKTLLKQDQPDKAIDTFVRAAAQAKRNGKQAEAFEYLRKAAIVNHQEGQLRPAIDRFRLAATSYPTDPKAPETHLMAVFNAAELYQTFATSGQATDAAKTLPLYEQLLEEHLQQWPKDKPANQARVWYGRLVGAKGKWQKAIETYQAVETGSEHAVEAYDRLGKLYQRMFSHSPTGVVEARTWIAKRFSAERNPDASLVLAQHLAKLSLNFAPQDYDLADASLRQAMAATSKSNKELPALRVVALAGKDQSQTARQELAKLLPLSAETLLAILQGLQPIRDARPADAVARTIAIDCIKLLQTYGEQLRPDQQLLVQQTTADVSDNDTALQTYRQLAATHPKNRRIQLRYAELISLGRDRASRDAALQQWRKIVRQSKPQSAEWFRGKLGVAQTYFDKGEHEKAKEVTELLMTLYPTMGGAELKQRFQQLLERIK